MSGLFGDMTTEDFKSAFERTKKSNPLPPPSREEGDRAIAEAIEAFHAKTREGALREEQDKFRDKLRKDFGRIVAAELNQVARKSKNTQRIYCAEIEKFRRFCEQHSMPACPAAPEVVAYFLAEEFGKGKNMQTTHRQCAAIKYLHEQRGLPDPTHVHLVRAMVRHIAKLHREKMT